MIVDTLITWLVALLTWVASLLPQWTPDLPDLSGLASSLTGLNYWLPLAELAAVFVAFIILTPGFLAATLVVWIVAFIRGGSARA